MNELTLDQIIQARNRCAKIIALYGEQYLPIFERLENEIELRMKQQTLLERAIAIHDEKDAQKIHQLKYRFNSLIVADRGYLSPNTKI